MNPCFVYKALGKCNHLPKVAWGNLSLCVHCCHNWNTWPWIGPVLFSWPTTPCPSTSPCCLEAHVFLCPTCACCGPCFHYLGQFDFSVWFYFRFHPWGMRGLSPPCIPPSSLAFNKYLEYQSFDILFSTPRVLACAGRSTSWNTHP